MKKALFLLAPLLLAGSVEERLQTLETNVDYLGTKNQMETYGANMAPARAETEKGVGLFLDILYWHPKVNQRTAYTVTKSALTTSSIPNKGRNKFNEFDWDFGFRTGLTYNLPWNSWEISADYTRVRFSTSEHVAPGAVALTFVNISSTGEQWSGVAAAANASFSLNYQTATLSLGRHFFVSKTLSLYPTFGTKALWINQRQKVAYAGSSISPASQVGNEMRNDYEQKLRGIGPRFALATGWHLPRGFAIDAATAFALPFAQIRQHTLNNISNQPVSTHVDNRSSYHFILPNLMLRLALSYGRYLSQNSRYLNLSLGYESQYYWQALIWTVPSSIPQQFNGAAFYGLTAKASLAF